MKHFLKIPPPAPNPLNFETVPHPPDEIGESNGHRRPIT